MYHYSVTQWVFFFYFYCFFGWCFESTYVSVKTRKLTNRGFMHGPFLPLYGSGAIMLLLVSMPFQDNMFLTYVAGCIGATILEYVTGVTMEALFKVRYWDYSKQKFNFQGHICLKSTLAWGGLTILMTGWVHRYVESVVFLIPAQVLSAVTFVLTAVIFADFALSFKAAMDLRDLLIKLEDAKAELGRMQKRMDVYVALTTEEWEQKIKDTREELKQRKENVTNALTQKKEDFSVALTELFEEAGNAAQELEPARLLEKLQERFNGKRAELLRRKAESLQSMEKQLQRILRANPTFRSKEYSDTVEELRQQLNK
ncbi:MAG: hypothetical protein IKO03_05505 [Lachnospiraceae bacterium]|jgi:uncharacterized membrane protein|nr:hypothetical protein [Lachnospiraceae bacterium]